MDAYTRRQIKEIEEVISKGQGDDIFNYITVLDILRDDYEKVKESSEKIKKVSREIVSLGENENTKKRLTQDQTISIIRLFKKCLR